MTQHFALVTLLDAWLVQILVVRDHTAETGSLEIEVEALSLFLSLATLSRHLFLISRDSVPLLLNGKGLLGPSHRLSRGLSDRFLELGGYSCRLRLYLSTS